jgi:hypothetical protein
MRNANQTLPVGMDLYLRDRRQISMGSSLLQSYSVCLESIRDIGPCIDHGGVSKINRLKATSFSRFCPLQNRFFC